MTFMIVPFCVAPLLGVESALAGRAAELRLAILAYERGSCFPLEIVQRMLFELQCTELFATLCA